MIAPNTDDKNNCIPDGQLCQAFDPIMLLPEKPAELKMHSLTTSCMANACFYIYGSRGERFLCDFHYELERRVSDNSDNVFKYVFFDKNKTLKFFGDPPHPIRPGRLCWCGNDAEVVVIHSDETGNEFCAFHFRKWFFRHLSNGADPEKTCKIFDYRKRDLSNIYNEIINVPHL